jgi:penicillin-binding protein 2
MRDHALFIAFAPAEEPKVALAMVVENSAFGAQNAAPIARRVFDYVNMGQFPSLEDIDAVQKGQATRPIGKPRAIADVPWPPKSVDVASDADGDEKFPDKESSVLIRMPLGAASTAAKR